MSDDGEDLCGEPNKTGGACKNPAVNPDGSCHIKAHGSANYSKGGEGGRPSKLTPERQARICDALAEGYSNKVAARMNGISTTTFARWRQRGKAAEEAGNEGRYREFWESTERAITEGEQMWTERAYKAAVEADSFGAMMEILRKRYPDSWGGDAHEDEQGSGLRVMLSDERSDGKDYAMRPDDAEQ